MAVDAMLAVKTTNSEGEVRYPVKAVSVLKAHGKSARESTLMNGYALNMGRASQGLTKRVDGARIACLDMNLQKQRMHMGIQVAHRLIPTCTTLCSIPISDDYAPIIIDQYWSGMWHEATPTRPKFNALWYLQPLEPQN